MFHQFSWLAGAAADGDRESGKAVAAERSDMRAEHVTAGHMKIDGRCPLARKTARRVESIYLG